MNRICIEKTTGKLIEMQGGGEVERLSQDKMSDQDYAKLLADCDALEASRLDTLKQNAINAGYKEDEIEVRWATDEEWVVIEAELNKPTPEQIATQERETLIQAKMREMAEAELIAEGKL